MQPYWDQTRSFKLGLGHQAICAPRLVMLAKNMIEINVTCVIFCHILQYGGKVIISQEACLNKCRGYLNIKINMLGHNISQGWLTPIQSLCIFL